MPKNVRNYERSNRKNKNKTKNLPRVIVIGEKEIFDKKANAKQFNNILMILDLFSL